MITKEKLDSGFGRCCVCGRIIAATIFHLKHHETGRVICVFCWSEIFKVKPADD